MKLLRARVVYPVCGPAIADGAVLVRAGRIVAVGKHRAVRAGSGLRAEDLGDVILMPGLINAHCHLDYTGLRKAILSPRTFTQWIRRINAIKSAVSDADYLAAIRVGIAESVRFGTTSMLNIESFPDLMGRIERPPLRIWWCRELLDVRKPVGESVFRRAQRLPHGWLGGWGMSPHAPYTASVGLYRKAARYCAMRRIPFTTHLAESAEEDAMFRLGSGPLHDLLDSLGRTKRDLGRGSALRGLLEAGALPRGAVLAHMNTLDVADLELLRTHPVAKTFHVVHCPVSHRYFGHPEFSLAALRRAGVRVSLGTDSLASADRLSLFGEMRTARETWPGLDEVELIRMVTVNPAAALRRAGRLGEIVMGAHADLIGLPFAGSVRDAAAAIVAHKTPVTGSWVGGRVVPR